MISRTFANTALAALLAAGAWLLLAPSFFALFPLLAAVTAASVLIAGAPTDRLTITGHAARASFLLTWATIIESLLLAPFVPYVARNAADLAASIDANMVDDELILNWGFIPFVGLTGWTLWRSTRRLVAGLRRPVDWACLLLGPLGALGIIVLGFLGHLLLLQGALKIAQEDDLRGLWIVPAWLPLIVAGTVLSADLWRGTIHRVPRWHGLVQHLLVLLEGSLALCAVLALGVLLYSIVVDAWVGMVAGFYVALIHGFILFHSRRGAQSPRQPEKRTSGYLILLLLVDAGLAIFATSAIALAEDKGPMPYDLVIPPFIGWLMWKLHFGLIDYLRIPIGRARDWVREPVPSWVDMAKVAPTA